MDLSPRFSFSRKKSDNNFNCKKFTEVNPKVFEQMVTNEGLSIAKMNELGVKVVLFFSSSLACPYCQGTIDDIYALKAEFAKLNSVPVICHNESNEIWDEFVNFGEENKKFGELLHLDRSKFNSEFKLDKTVFSIIKQTLGSGLQELKRLKSNKIKGKMSWWTEENKNTLAAVFVVSESKIVYEFRKSDRSERLDLARIIIDPEKEGIEVHTTNYQCDYLKKKSLNSKKISPEKSPLLNIYDRNSSELKKPLSELTLKYIETQKIELKDVLENDRYREYFKVYTMSKYCIENMMFYEEVLKYKKTPKEKRESIGKLIVDVYFDPNSDYEINTNLELKEKAKKSLEEKSDDAFDEIIGEISNSVLIGLFRDFKNSTLYVDMILEKKLE